MEGGRGLSRIRITMASLSEFGLGVILALDNGSRGVDVGVEAVRDGVASRDDTGAPPAVPCGNGVNDSSGESSTVRPCSVPLGVDWGSAHRQKKDRNLLKLNITIDITCLKS